MSIDKKLEEKKWALFICSPFFGYYKHIISEIELLGYKVDYYNDRPSENSIIKGIVKIKRDFVKGLIKKYFDNILKEIEEKEYDIVFIMNCKVLTVDIVERIKESQRNARFIFYTWDALELYPQSKELISLFDKSYSFDSEDCKKISKLNLLPLFYSKPYEMVTTSESKYSKYDVLNICTVHPNRYKILCDILPYFNKNGISVYSYMYINKFQYFYNKIFIKEFKKARKKEFKFIPLSEKEMIKKLRDSKVVLDIQHEKQSGLTIRTLEALGAKKKIITTNVNIQNYDFYIEDNIFILGKDNQERIYEFISKDYIEIDDRIYKKYSLNSWVKVLLDVSEN